MKSFLKKVLKFGFIGSIPFFLILASYFYYDPFKVLYNYESYYSSDEQVRVYLDQDYVSTSTFLNKKEKYNYNSFILGNSRSIFYQSNYWKKYIGDNSSCFHFDASGESLFGIQKKIELIDKEEESIDNMLLILDYETLKNDQPNEGHLAIISPALVNNSNFIEFHYTFISTYYNLKFLRAYLDFKFSNEMKQYMKEGFLLDDRPRFYDSVSNEIRFDHYEEQIKNGEFYTKERMKVFYERNSEVEIDSICISENQIKMLTKMAKIIRKHNTNLKIIINPLYNQKELNSSDISKLNEIFGEDNIFDFSGKNNITEDYTNYYESSHYRPHIANRIMDIIYSSETINLDSLNSKNSKALY